MSVEIIKKYFKDDEEEFNFHPPILCRQVATHIIYNEELNIFVDGSIEINNILRREAYIRECLNEYLKKYENYKNYKKIFYSINIFKKIMKNKFPIEIILEVLKYL
jgi:hypothetical protein